jgi:hypothetical protein
MAKRFNRPDAHRVIVDLGFPNMENNLGCAIDHLGQGAAVYRKAVGEAVTLLAETVATAGRVISGQPETPTEESN